MKNRLFIKNALLKSFTNPVSHERDCCFSSFSDSAGNLYFTLKSESDLAPYFVHPKLLKRLKKLCKNTVKSEILLSEFNQYCHDFCENIIIPEENAETKKLKNDFFLNTVNRQTAQKRVMLTRIIPAECFTKLTELADTYQKIRKRINKSLQESPETHDIIYVEEFRRTYLTAIRCLQGPDLLLWKNKKLFKKYTSELLSQIFQNKDINYSNLLTFPFYGDKIKILKPYISRYRAHLLRIACCIQNLREKPELIGMAQALLTDPKRFNRSFQDFRNCRADVNTDDLISLRNTFVQFHQHFMLLCYLSSAAQTLESQNFNINDLKQQPALPTVSPKDELKKVYDLLKKSCEQPSSQSCLAKFYSSARQNFNSSANHFETLWAKFRGMLSE